MFGLKNKGDNNEDKLINFLDICEFIETYTLELRIGIIIAVAILIFMLNIINGFFFAIMFALLLGNLIFEIICLFTLDRQYSVIYKQLKYPLVVKEIDINKEDELANINNENPKIPGLNFKYEIKKKTNENFAVAFEIDENSYKVLTSVNCDDDLINVKKIGSDILMQSFVGMKKDAVYSNKCLILKILRLKREVSDLEIINKEDIDDTLIITECVYYPYIK